MDLVLPGIVAGMIGNGLGTYLGFLIAWMLQAVPSSISAAHAVPPPPDQLVADCTHPTYASDMLVCGDPELLGARSTGGRFLEADPTRHRSDTRLAAGGAGCLVSQAQPVCILRATQGLPESGLFRAHRSPGRPRQDLPCTGADGHPRQVQWCPLGADRRSSRRHWRAVDRFRRRRSRAGRGARCATARGLGCVRPICCGRRDYPPDPARASGLRMPRSARPEYHNPQISTGHNSRFMTSVLATAL